MKTEKLVSDIKTYIPETGCEIESTAPSLGEVVIGTLVSINSSGIPQINYPGNPASKKLDAMTTVPLSKDHIGRQIALLFQNGDPAYPLIIGLIRNFLDDLQVSNKDKPSETSLDISEDKEVFIDGERVVFNAEKEIVLKCGKASITLTKAGKVLIRGTYLSNRSSGVNRIKGGSVQIN